MSGRNVYVREGQIRKEDALYLFCIFKMERDMPYEGKEGGEDENGISIDRRKIDVELSDNRKLGIVTLGAMKQYDRN